MIVRCLLLTTALLATTGVATAAESLGSDDIKATVNRYMAVHIADLANSYGENVRIEYQIKNLDPRLALAACPAPLNTELKSVNNMGRINLKVSCAHQQRWSIYVPVEVDLYRSVVVAMMPISRGEQISASQLDQREMNISQLNGSYFTDLNDVLGMQARRTLNADSPIIAQHIEPPLIIKKGETVLVTAKSGGLAVKIPGIALNDGHQGQQISVRNKQSKRVIEARVTGPGQVSITM